MNKTEHDYCVPYFTPILRTYHPSKFAAFFLTSDPS